MFGFGSSVVLGFAYTLQLAAQTCCTITLNVGQYEPDEKHLDDWMKHLG